MIKYWVITDSHFGHEKMMGDVRPIGFDHLLFNNLEKQIRKEDVLIHLGDVAFNNDHKWHEDLLTKIPGKKWLIRGNHDKRSYTWYLDRGWDFVGDTFSMHIYGRDLVFSHTPVPGSYDLNIHGHFHNVDPSFYEPELVSIKNDRQFLASMEWSGYRPIILEHIVLDFQKGISLFYKRYFKTDLFYVRGMRNATSVDQVQS